MDQRRLWAICLVKNEDDIIAQTLRHATRYCNRIFVLDNGSTDETWHAVRRLAEQNKIIVPFARTLESFSDGLRGLVYNAVRGELSDDDWWFILDSDEFLAEDPRPVIETAVREGAEIIKSWQINFHFTTKDLATWEQGEDRRDIPIFDRRRYYLINWQETRLFRHHPGRTWDVHANRLVPDWLRRVCTRRIMIRHYQFRDPEQIGKRLRLRYDLRLPGRWSYVESTDWRSAITDLHGLTYHEEGRPWRFTASGLLHYYRLAVGYKCNGGAARLRRFIAGRGRQTAD